MPRQGGSKEASPAPSPKSATFGRLSSFTSKLKKKLSYSTLSTAQDIKKSKSHLFLELPPSPHCRSIAADVLVPKSAPASAANKTFLPAPVQESKPLRGRMIRSHTTETLGSAEQIAKERVCSPTPSASPSTPYELVQGQRATLAPFHFTTRGRQLNDKPVSAFSIEDEQILPDDYDDCSSASPFITTPQDVIVHQSRPPLVSKWTETISTIFQHRRSISPRTAEIPQNGFPFPMQPTNSLQEETLASPARSNIFTRKDLDQLANIQTSPSSAQRYREIRRNFIPMPDLIASTSTYQSSEFVDSELEISLTLRRLEGRDMSWSDASTIEEGYTADTSMEVDESPSNRPTLIAPVKYLHAGTQSDTVEMRSVAVQTEPDLSDRKGSNCTQGSTFGCVQSL